MNRWPAPASPEEVGGLAYLNALAHNTRRRPTSAAMPRSCASAPCCASWCRSPTRSRRPRSIRKAGGPPVAGRGRIQGVQDRPGRRTRLGGFQEIQPLLTQVVERIDELYHRESESDVTGVPTGFADLDKMTSGLQAGDLVIVAGRPSMGKTSFSMNIGEHVAIEQGLPVAVFSMEMGAVQLAMRMLGSVGMLDQHRAYRQAGRRRLAARHPRGATDAGRAGLHRQKRPRSARWKCAPARRLARQCGQLGLIIIDYLQLMSANSAGENRATEISNQPLAQGPGQGAQLSADRAVAAQPQPGAAPQQAAGNEATCANPAPSSRTPT